MASSGFEPANLGTNGQHATPRPQKLICRKVYSFMFIRLSSYNNLVTLIAYIYIYISLYILFICIFIYINSPFREVDARLVIQNFVWNWQIESASSHNNKCFKTRFQLADGLSKLSLTWKFSDGHFTIICKVPPHTWFVRDQLLLKTRNFNDISRSLGN
jgi:hypothetical protein